MRLNIHTLLHHAKQSVVRFDEFLGDEEGATAIEYGLIVSLVFLAIMAGVNQVADTNSEMYDEITSAMASAG